MLGFRPKYDKILELLLYLAHRKPGADKYQAVKFFYLADKTHFERFGRPITYESYFALKYGPVASTAKDLLEGNAYMMKKAGAKVLPFEVGSRSGKSPDHRGILVIGKPRRDVDFELFSKSDIAVFDEILEKYGDCDFEELYQITHGHEAYKNAWSRRGISNRHPIDYAEMIEDRTKRQRILTDVGPVATRM